MHLMHINLSIDSSLSKNSSISYVDIFPILSVTSISRIWNKEEQTMTLIIFLPTTSIDTPLVSFSWNEVNSKLSRTLGSPFMFIFQRTKYLAIALVVLVLAPLILLGIYKYGEGIYLHRRYNALPMIPRFFRRGNMNPV